MIAGVTSGFQFPKIGRFCGWRIRPLSTTFKFPPLAMMIIVALIVRNYGGKVVEAYPLGISNWAQFLALGIASMRAGLALSFKERMGLKVLLVALPQVLEATAIALISSKLFEFPIAVGFTLGFILSSLSPSLIVPAMIQYML